jgi:STE24 endopeptidase
MRERSIVVLIGAGLLIASVVRAAAEAPPPFDPEKARLAATIADPAAATRAYLDAVPAERRARTKAYARGNYVLDVAEFLLQSAVLAALVGFGVSARLRDRARRVSRFTGVQHAAYWVQFLILVTVLWFPLTVYRSYLREKAYGLLTQAFSGWLADQALALGLGLVIGSLLVMALYAVLRLAPRSWWIWAAGVFIGFAVLGSAVAPVFIAPLFNRFTPVHDAAIRQHVLDMARAKGIPADDVYEMDASKRTDRISAYVSGMLGTTRIVMFDTTLKRCTPAEIQMIMGHEMGHYVLNHVWKGIGFLSVLVLVGFFFVRSSYAWASARWPQMGVAGVADVAGFPLLWLLLSLVFFVTAPVSNTLTRTLETQADDFGLDASHEPDAAATTFLKLGEYRDLEPDPWVEAVFFDHPSGRNRIRNAMEWKAAHR